MSSQQPHVTTVDGKRRFACSPVAVLVFILNEREEVLLLAHPKREGGWEVVNGALEAGETVLEAALRETREEAGTDIRIHPLGTVHVSTFHYDERVRYMLSVGVLMAYEDGEVRPGDDMEGSEYRWWSLEELADEEVRIIIPPDGKWLIGRAVDLYRLWKEEVVHPPGFDLTVSAEKAK
jgi:8-oxo-dGTP pyrophosphatase MutT (NUDIX family)